MGPDIGKTWILHHENVPSLTSLNGRMLLAQKNNLTPLPPAYRPHLALCNFLLVFQSQTLSQWTPSRYCLKRPVNRDVVLKATSDMQTSMLRILAASLESLCSVPGETLEVIEPNCMSCEPNTFVLIILMAFQTHLVGICPRRHEGAGDR